VTDSEGGRVYRVGDIEMSKSLGEMFTKRRPR
jgi:hypothetical protein